MAILMSFGGFYRDPNMGVNSPWPVRPRPKLIMHCLQHELWQNASIMH